MKILKNFLRNLTKKESLVVLFALGLVVLMTLLMVYLTRKDNEQTKTDEETVVLTKQEFTKANRFNTDSLDAYATKDACWMVYKGEVYDVTDILSNLKDLTEDDCGTTLTKDVSTESLSKMSPYLIAYTYQGGPNE